MKITKVKYYDIGVSGCKNFLARCSVVFDDCVILHDVKVLNGEKGRYIIMPEKLSLKNGKDVKKNKEGEDVFHPVRQSYSYYMKEVILKGFEEYENGGCKVYIPY